MKIYDYFGAVGSTMGHILTGRSQVGRTPVPAIDPVVLNSLAACVVCANNQYRTPLIPRWWRN